MKLKNSIQLGRLKSRVLELRGYYQLPSYLVYLILHIGNDTPLEVVGLLKECSTHYLRVRGYYKKYPEIQVQYNQELKKQFNSKETD